MENTWREKFHQVEIKSISANYGSLKVIDDLSIQLNKGEIVSLIGPSGSGKSTLLKLLVGLIKPTQGEVVIQNRTINFVLFFFGYYAQVRPFFTGKIF